MGENIQLQRDTAAEELAAARGVSREHIHREGHQVRRELALNGQANTVVSPPASARLSSRCSTRPVSQAGCGREALARRRVDLCLHDMRTPMPTHPCGPQGCFPGGLAEYLPPRGGRVP